MKIITRHYKTYKYLELSTKAKERAIYNEIEYCLKYIPYQKMSLTMKKACDKAEQNRTPWFSGAYVSSDCKDEIINRLKHFRFIKNGEKFNQ